MNRELQRLGIGVCDVNLGKQLGQGLFEFRLRVDAGAVVSEYGLPPESVLLRVFCHAYGDKIVLLLGGYDKGEDASPKRQDNEIAIARKRLVRWKQLQRSPGKR